MTDSVSMFSTYSWQFLFLVFQLLSSLRPSFRSDIVYIKARNSNELRSEKFRMSFSRLAAEMRLVISNRIPNFRNRTNESKRIEKNMTKSTKWNGDCFVVDSFCSLCSFFRSFVFLLFFSSANFSSIQWRPQI